jgi:transposase
LAAEVRLVLSDGQWRRIESLCAGKASDPGVSGRDNRMFVEGVLWIARTGSPWRDLPPVFGAWNSVFIRFNRWSCQFASNRDPLFASNRDPLWERWIGLIRVVHRRDPRP